MKAQPKTKKRKASGRVTGTLSDPVRSSLVSKEKDKTFRHLNLQNLGIKAEIGTTKCRTHTNPFASKYSIPVEPPEWDKIYGDMNLPLFIDVGCGAGRFSLTAASSDRWKSYNHLGIEIREALVTRANAWKNKMELKNCFFVFANANVSLDDMLSTYPGEVHYICIQFPDPHFKRKHQKRRVLNEKLLEVLAKYLKTNIGILFLQSDIESISSEMRDRAMLSNYFTRQGEYTERDEKLIVSDNAWGDVQALWTVDGKRMCEKNSRSDYGDWLVGENPLGILTERECQNNALKLPIYRSLFKRNQTAYVESNAYRLSRRQERILSLKMFASELKTKAQSLNNNNINFNKILETLRNFEEKSLPESVNTAEVTMLLQKYKSNLENLLPGENSSLMQLIENNILSLNALMKEIKRTHETCPLKS